jgi:translation initiation factor IF-1
MGKVQKDDKLEMHGTVEDALPNAMFKVKTDNSIVLATLSGKMRMNHVKIIPGDRVTIEVSVYDTSRGRITWRDR